MPIVSTKGIAIKQSSLTEKELKHLLRRTTFGLSKDLLNQYQNKSLNTVIDEILTVSPEFEKPLNYDPNFKKYSIEDTYGETWVNNELNYGQEIRVFRRSSFISNTIQKHIKATDITEKMTLFLHHFIPVGDEEFYAGDFYWNYRLLRDNCLGNFKTIIRKMSINNAMLIYLNGRNNQVGAPDENYARELMELFTLGKNYSPIYSESDIQQAAKILTGYENSKPYGYSYKFTPSRHDTSDKIFSSFFGNKVIKGRTGADGEKELDELIDMIFEKDEVSIYFATRLYRFFVYYEIDETVMNNVIKPLAKIMRDNNYDIKPVIEALLKSEHFYDTNVLGSHIKNPLDLVYGAVKEFKFFPFFSGILWRYRRHEQIYKPYLKKLGMFQYDVPDVAGWKAYYQEPLMYENWISTSSVLDRVEIVLSLFTDFGFGNKVDVIWATKQHSNPSDVNALIADILNWHLTVEPSDDLIAYMKSILLYGQSEDHYWTDLWNAHIANPNDTEKRTIVTGLLKQLYEYLVSLPEYQLM